MHLNFGTHRYLRKDYLGFRLKYRPHTDCRPVIPWRPDWRERWGRFGEGEPRGKVRL